METRPTAAAPGCRPALRPAEAARRSGLALGKKTSVKRTVDGDASRCGGAAARGVGVLGASLAWLGLQACAPAGPPQPDASFATAEATRVAVHAAPAPSDEERYCAWYGNAGADGVLYFGQAAFWSAKAAAGGDPRGDLDHPGPQLVGRFDLESERLLPSLRVDAPDADPPARSGVWDVLASDDGRVAFTTFYEGAGWVDIETGAVTRIEASEGLNELAPGPDGQVLATRYGSGDDEGGDGALALLGLDGTIAHVMPLPERPGYVLAPKTPAFDAARERIWLTADWLPRDAGLRVSFEAIRIDLILRPARNVEPAPPELQFVAAGPDGTLYRALVYDARLVLGVTPPQAAAFERLVPLDDAFAAGLDFVQDVQPAADGRVAVTRWSGRVDVVHPDGRVGRIRLPRPDPDGLYYTAVLHGGRLCATYCADVAVVCADAP